MHAMDTKAFFPSPPSPLPMAQGVGTKVNFAEFTHICNSLVY